MIAIVDPIRRLELLKEYMSFWIDKWPTCSWSFETFLHRRHAYIIPGTIDHTKSIATHCYYCGEKFRSTGDLFPTVDHWMPLSLGQTEKYVISCFGCNNNKGNTHPDKLVKQMVSANLKGLTMWGKHGKKLKHISDQIQHVTNDMLYNMGPRIYYIKK